MTTPTPARTRKSATAHQFTAQNSDHRDSRNARTGQANRTGITRKPKSGDGSHCDASRQEDPPGTRPDSHDAPTPRRSLKEATPDAVAREHAAMLVELSCEAHAFALDCFEAARGTQAQVAVQARKLALAAKLAGLTMQLVAASDKHRRAAEGE